MLFNTLAYAKFFGVVFVVAWLLIQRWQVIWVPWIGLFATVAFSPPLSVNLSAWGWVLGLLGLTVAVWRVQRLERYASLALLASVVCNLGAMAWLLFRQYGASLPGVALGVLRAPVPPLLNTGLASALGALVCMGLVWRLLRARQVRLLFLLLASYVFYAHWDYRFLALIFASSSVDYWLGLKVGEVTEPVAKRRWLWLTVVVNLGALAAFKYLNFGIDSAQAALHALGVEVPPLALQIALPVGISFFTFESMSYVIDVYRGQLPAHKNYFEYLSFVAFFPHLVAGPIVRPRDLLPQLAGPARWSAAQGSEALYLIAWGLLKKVAIADTLALNLVDRVFDAPTQFSSLECYVAVVAYAVQIYCDFSGYTDVAIGSALLLGVRFPLNFNSPYKAENIQDFWRRWHISLSTWLRDYLYISLGGNRRGPVRTRINLLLTMVLGGLWHGANWTFVVWGGLHGLALAVQRALPAGANTKRPWWRRGLAVLVTFHFVCLAWIFFRAESFERAWALFVQLGQGTHFASNLHWTSLSVLAVGLVSHGLPAAWYGRCQRGFVALPAVAQGVLLCVVAWILREMSNAEAVPFVYFQF